MEIKTAKKLLYPAVSVLLFITVWYAAAKAVGIEIILPSPSAAVREFWALCGTSYFWDALLSTLGRSLISFFVSLLFALLLSAAGGVFDPLHRLLSPVILIFRATPTISIILLSLIWMTSNTAPMLIAFLIIFPAMYAAFYGGIKAVNPELIEMSKVYRVGKRDMLLKLYIPSIAPVIFNTAKSNISLNLKIIIASEVLAQTGMSMGLMMQQSKIYLDTALLMAWTVSAVLLSYLLETAVELFKRAAIRWQA